MVAWEDGKLCGSYKSREIELCEECQMSGVYMSCPAQNLEDIESVQLQLLKTDKTQDLFHGQRQS